MIRGNSLAGYVHPFDQLIGEYVEANAYKVQVGKGNLYRHGSFKTELVTYSLVHASKVRAFITHSYDNYIPRQGTQTSRTIDQTPTFENPYKGFYMTGG